MDYEQKIQKLGLTLPPPAAPAGSYVPVVVSGSLAFLSGQISKAGERAILGKVGRDLSLDEGREAARLCALNVLSLIRHIVTFERFERIARVVGYVQADPSFYDIPKVVNGASDLFVEVFGEKGKHARSAVGMASLPLNAAVELEVTVELK